MRSGVGVAAVSVAAAFAAAVSAAVAFRAVVPRPAADSRSGRARRRHGHPTPAAHGRLPVRNCLRAPAAAWAARVAWVAQAVSAARRRRVNFPAARVAWAAQAVSAARRRPVNFPAAQEVERLEESAASAESVVSGESAESVELEGWVE